MSNTPITPHWQNSTWVLTPQAFQYCWSNPTDQHCHLIPEFYGDYCWTYPVYPLCDNVPNYYDYRIDLVPNALFLAIFAACFVALIAIWVVTRRATAFNVALLLGLVCEILGYAGRIMSWKNQWQENGFLMQICCLTIGPAFMAAGIYLCLRRIVTAFGAENSRIAPEYYTRIVSFSPPPLPVPSTIGIKVSNSEFITNNIQYSSSPAMSSPLSSKPSAAPWPPSPPTKRNPQP